MQNTNDSNEWIEEAISKKHLKYYDYKGFHNIQKTGYGNFGKVYRANWKNSEQYFVLKSFNVDNTIIKDVIHEVIYNVIICFSVRSTVNHLCINPLNS